MSRRAVFTVTAFVTVVLGGAVAASAIQLVRNDDGPGSSGPSTSAAPSASARPSSAPRSSSPASPTRTTRLRTEQPTPQGRRSRHTPVPRIGARYVFPVAHCETSYSSAHHDYPAADIFAGDGCQFVSPVDGVVDEVNRIDRWNNRTNIGIDRGGLSVSVVGVDRVRYYGSHLAAVLPGIEPGSRVRAGTSLGRIGDTGSARGVGTHLHFGISWPTPPDRWWVRRGAVPPTDYLDAWRAGRALSPKAEVDEARLAHSGDSQCRSYC